MLLLQGSIDSIEPPWRSPSASGEAVATLSHTLEKRIPNSYSAPASGFSELSYSRLPKAQNPTITLLQKARGKLKAPLRLWFDRMLLKLLTDCRRPITTGRALHWQKREPIQQTTQWQVADRKSWRKKYVLCWNNYRHVFNWHFLFLLQSTRLDASTSVNPIITKEREKWAIWAPGNSTESDQRPTTECPLCYDR